jgi:GT2 family glycosyltransferase
VSAIIIARNRPRELAIVLDRLAELPVDEVVLVENGATGVADAVGAGSRSGVRVIRLEENIGIAGRNLAAEHAHGDFLLLLDDDSYPLPGAVETLAAALRADARLAVAGGLVRDVDENGVVVLETEPGTFDWFLRAGRNGAVAPEGLPTFFFPECAALVRRQAYLEVGGFFAPFFFLSVEVELTTRLLARGWDVRYFPAAPFHHMKSPFDRASDATTLYYRIRNHLWYLWLHFPPTVAARRIPGYLAFDLIESVYRRAPRAWLAAVADAWRLRETVRHARRPLPRAIIRRAELNRGRMHARLLAHQLARRLPGPRAPA